MKATLEFNLPEEQEEFEAMRNGIRWEHIVWQIDRYLRNELKLDPPYAETKALENLHDFLCHKINEEGLTL